MATVSISAGRSVYMTTGRMERLGRRCNRTGRYSRIERLHGTARRSRHQQQGSGLTFVEPSGADVGYQRLRCGDEGIGYADCQTAVRGVVPAGAVQNIEAGDGTLQRRLDLGLCPKCVTAFDGANCGTCGLTISKTVLQK